jgi:hypothetical protein
MPVTVLADEVRQEDADEAVLHVRGDVFQCGHGLRESGRQRGVTGHGGAAHSLDEGQLVESGRGNGEEAFAVETPLGVSQQVRDLAVTSDVEPILQRGLGLVGHG